MKPKQHERLKKRETKAGSRASKRRDRRVGFGEFFNPNIPILPDVLRWLLLFLGVAMILGAGVGWPYPTNPRQVLLGLGGALLVIFALFGIRRTLAKVAKTLAKLGF